jgi:hypothetical protein
VVLPFLLTFRLLRRQLLHAKARFLSTLPRPVTAVVIAKFVQRAAPLTVLIYLQLFVWPATTQDLRKSASPHYLSIYDRTSGYRLELLANELLILVPSINNYI